jgi:hypothetical protein
LEYIKKHGPGNIKKPKETRCEAMENESIGKRGMGINYKGSQGQTERAVVL